MKTTKTKLNAKKRSVKRVTPQPPAKFPTRELWNRIASLEQDAWQERMDSWGMFFGPSKAVSARWQAFSEVQKIILELLPNHPQT